MSQDHILPALPDVIGAAKDAIVGERPKAEAHVETGNYAIVLSGWRGQYAKAVARMIDEAKSSRLALAEGDALTPIAAIDYFTPRQPDPLRAVGEVVLARTVIHYTDTDPVTAALATNDATTFALIAALAAAYNPHVQSVWDPLVGLGAHLVDDGSVLLATPTATMADLVGLANNAIATINAHLLGDGHLDPDTVNAIAVEPPFVSAGGSGYGSQSEASKQSLHRALNACRTAINAHVGLEARAGTIRKGSRFSRAAQSESSPPLLAASYETLLDMPIGTGAASVTIPIQAATAGANGSLPAWVAGQGPPTVVKADARLFDAAAPAQVRLGIASTAAGGGRDGPQPDRPLRQAAKAAFSALSGPLIPALFAGALRGLGASRAAVLTDYARGGVVVYVTDESWAQSQRWLESIARIIKDPDKGWLGLGCRLRSMGPVANRIVQPELTVSLRDTRYLQDTDELTATIQGLIRAYFDDRDEWYLLRSSSLRAICSAADRKRILTCSQLKLRDGAGVPIPDLTLAPAGDTLIHNAFADQPLDITYTVPT